MGVLDDHPELLEKMSAGIERIFFHSVFGFIKHRMEAAYRVGVSDGMRQHAKVQADGYADGIRDSFWAIKKVFLDPSDGGFTEAEFYKAFGSLTVRKLLLEGDPENIIKAVYMTDVEKKSQEPLCLRCEHHVQLFTPEKPEGSDGCIAFPGKAIYIDVTQGNGCADYKPKGE